MWVDKHGPQSLKQVIGQQDNARKLAHWMKNWHNAVKKPSRNDRYKAALLSGPPGVGKTTCAQLACKEMGFSYIELNASDTRSKKSLQTEVSEVLNSHTLVDFIRGNKNGHCLIMDEVDEMDRGGMQELVRLIKNTKIPVICICNDRFKVRSLANYCFDLRFQRPRVEQIKAAMTTIALKEGLKIPHALNDIILASNRDVRHVIHNLSTVAQKDVKLGPFDVCRKVFASEKSDKLDLFFNDYSLGPLFVQENYIHVKNRGDLLHRLSKAADSIAQGDLVDRKIKRGENWELLPIQAIYASLIPGEEMKGMVVGEIQFPSWLGKNSSRGKHERIIRQLQSHMSLNISAGKRALNLDYLPFMRESFTGPLLCGEVSQAVNHLVRYDLTRDDFDSVLKVTTWPNSSDPMKKVESKVKAAFTRTFNKGSHLTPYMTGMTLKKKRGRDALDGSQDESDDDDTMIKQTVKKREVIPNRERKGARIGDKVKNT